MADQNIEDLFEDLARKGHGQFAVAFALLQLTREHRKLAQNVQALGLGDAASPMGAIELLSKSVSEAGEQIAAAVERSSTD